MKLDPGNKELQTLLQKSKDKFLEVEGKGEWREDSVPLESSGPGPDSASDSIFITVPVKKESERDFLSFSSNFSCLEIMNEGKYFERNISVSSNKHESRVGKDGEKEREKVKEIGTEIATNSEQESEFTRVVISFDDDDEDEDDDEGKVEKDLKTSVEGEIVLLTQIHDNNDFTRIEITEGGSDSDEDEDKKDNEVERKSELKVGDMSVGYDNLKGKNVEEKVISKEEMETSSFTRIVIEDEDEDEDNGNERDQQILVEKDEIVTMVEKNETHARTNLDSKVEKTVVQEVISTNAATSLIKQDNNKLKSDVDTKNITEKTATTDVDRKRKSEELKLAGNEEMKNMNYLSALSLYTQSLELDQSNLLTRNNRSQAYLKLNQFKESVNDATYILENDPTYPKSGTLDNGISSVPSSAQSDPVSSTVKKAIFRRATVSEQMQYFVLSLDFFCSCIVLSYRAIFSNIVFFLAACNASDNTVNFSGK